MSAISDREAIKLTFRLEIAVDVTVQMKVFQRCNHFCSVEFGVLFRQAFPWASLKRPEELSSHTVLTSAENFEQMEKTHVEDKEQMISRLKRVK